MASAYYKLLQTSCKHILKRNVLPKPFTIPVSCISTTKKTKDTATIESVIQTDKKERKLTDKVSQEPQVKDWISYGFDFHEEAEDRRAMRLVFFGSITMCIVGTTFIWKYQPDHKMKDWVLREAYLELNRREREGLPLVDRELIPLDKIVLPDEEELKGVEIII